MASNRQAIEEQAATWLQKRDGEAWGADDQSHLSQWLDADTHHRVAFRRLEAAWTEMNRLQAIGAGYPRSRVPSAEELEAASPGLPFRATAPAVASPRDGKQDARESGAPDAALPSVRASGAPDPALSSERESGTADLASSSLREGERRLNSSSPRESTRHGASRSLRVTLAACLLIALVIGGGASYFWTQFARVDSYSTPLGGLASVPIKDGSNITLSSASAVRVRLGYSERQVDLAQGEAFFEVAKDAKRPFVVAVGGDRVIAVGTKFSVRRNDAAGLRVVVTEGTVRLEHGASARLLPAGSIARINGNSVRGNSASDNSVSGHDINGNDINGNGVSGNDLSSNDVNASANDVLVQTASISNAESLLSWRSGYVVFHETPLADAVAEFNRYNPRKLVIDDPRIATIRLTGKFRSTNIDSFSRLLQQSFPVQATEGAAGIVLSAAESKAPSPSRSP